MKAKSQKMFKFKDIILFLGIIVLNVPMLAQEDIAVIWQGFEHAWTYNHRLNRLGDYIDQSEFDGYPHRVKHFHTGATGLGKDIASFQSYYSVVKAKGIGVQSGAVEFKLTGKENKLVTDKITVEIKAEKGLQNKDNVTALFNGFDFISEDGADKLKMFKVDFSDPIYDPTSQKLQFDIQVSVILNCASLECHRFKQKFDYDLSIHYLLIAGNNQSFHAQEKTFFKTYEWDKKEPVAYKLIDQQAQGFANFPIATLGFKSFTLEMDSEHWLVDWHTSLHPQSYDARKGKLFYSLDLLFRQWKRDMKRLSPFKGQSRFSKKKDGWIYFGGSVVMLQFKNGCLEQKARLGTIEWDGMNKTPYNYKAINVERFKIEKGCR